MKRTSEGRPFLFRQLPRAFVEKVRALTYDRLRTTVGPYLTDEEIRAVLIRKDLLLKEIEGMIDVLRFLVGKELLSPEWAERLLSWRHTGFSVYSRVRAKTSVEAERVGKYMIRPLLSLERFSFEKEGQVSYRYGKDKGDQERMDFLEFIARVTSHIPDKGQVMVRYYGLYANAHRGKVEKANLAAFPPRIIEDKLRRIPSKGWAECFS